MATQEQGALLWEPDEERRERATLTRYMAWLEAERGLSFDDYGAARGFTGSGRAFCAGEDMKESLQRGAPGRGQQAIADPFMDGSLSIFGGIDRQVPAAPPRVAALFNDVLAQAATSEGVLLLDLAW